MLYVNSITEPSIYAAVRINFVIYMYKTSSGISQDL